MITKRDIWCIQETDRRIAREEGEKIGIKKGQKEGREEGVLATAKKLLALGIPMETVTEATGLPAEKILALR